MSFRIADGPDEVGQGPFDVAMVHQRLGQLEPGLAVDRVGEDRAVVAVDRLRPSLLRGEVLPEGTLRNRCIRLKLDGLQVARFRLFRAVR